MVFSLFFISDTGRLLVRLFDIQNALQSGSLDVDVLRAHMVLIPKGDNPDSITKFRPITLLNTSYKSLSKILVNRLRPLLQRILGPYQLA